MLPRLWGSDREDISVKLIGTQCGRELLVFLWLFNQENDVSLLTSLLPSVYLFGQASDKHYNLYSLLFMFVVSSILFFFSLLFQIAYFVDSFYFIS